MRTARLVVFASLFLSLLTGCADERDLGLQVLPEASGPAPAGGQMAAATGLPGGGPDATVSLASVGTATATSIVLPLATPLPSPQGSPLTPRATPLGPSPAAQEYTFDPSLWRQSLGSLRSFRQKAVLDFTSDESGIRSKVTYEGEVTVEPSALHSLVRVEGQGAAQLPTNQVEVTWISDRVWVKVGRKPWVSLPATAVPNMYDGEVVGAADLLPCIRQAERVLPDETVNGIPSQHYVYDVEHLPADVGMTGARGDLWVAREGGYLVRLTLQGQGTYYRNYAGQGTLRLVYDLYDVDVPLTIVPPR